MFQSVSLNVNNPHFLIMQGRITKVLNMKPPEILAMIEEAAGTRMFEDRKEKALKTLEKKESKVLEIVQVQLNPLVVVESNCFSYSTNSSLLDSTSLKIRNEHSMNFSGLRQNLTNYIVCSPRLNTSKTFKS